MIHENVNMLKGYFVGYAFKHSEEKRYDSFLLSYVFN